jgi:glutamate carboxypeptidase
MRQKMNTHTPYLERIAQDRSSMLDLVERWASINSGTENSVGLAAMITELEKNFRALKGESSRIDLPPIRQISFSGEIVELPVGQALSIFKRPEAPFKVFLGGHMDTVFPQNSPFQQVTRLSQEQLQGPGVADMKGGLVVMLKALEALEQSPLAHKIGWEVLITPDEEIGSISSAALLRQTAKRNQLGMIFEPALPDGALVSRRKGSASYTLVVRGRAAHVGRDFAAGRSAINAAAKVITALSALTDPLRGLLLNIGQIEGGIAANVVSDLAVCRLNIRFGEEEDLHSLGEKVEQIVRENQTEGIAITLHPQSIRPPKRFDLETEDLFEQFNESAKELGLSLSYRESGGVCDGNNLSAAGLTTLDTLGVVGGNIHTDQEYLLIDSLVERAQLSALFLLNLASQREPGR